MLKKKNLLAINEAYSIRKSQAVSRFNEIALYDINIVEQRVRVSFRLKVRGRLKVRVREIEFYLKSVGFHIVIIHFIVDVNYFI